MEIKRKNHSVLLRGLILVVAFALAIITFPVDQLSAMAASMSRYTDCTYMTIGRTSEEVETTITKGKEYKIPNAYIGGKTDMVVGKFTGDTTDATITSSKVTVRYNSYTLPEDGGLVTNGQTGVTVTASDPLSYGKFKADRVGTYTITYSYTYTTNDGKTFTNAYELKVNSELSTAAVSFEDNMEFFIPEVIDLSLIKADKGNGGNLYIPTPTIKDENGEVIKLKDASGEEIGDLPLVKDAGSLKDYILVTVNGGANSSAVTLSQDDKGIYIPVEVLKGAEGYTDFGAGQYTIQYSYYADGEFVTSTTKSTQVYSNAYYTNYELKHELASEWRDNGQTGVERTLPKAKGLTATSTTPASEEVDVFYTVEVKFKAKDSQGGFKALDATKYADVLRADGPYAGTLKDATKFKPLEDGSYAFVYTVYDFYGNKHSSSETYYEYRDITDETDPTPVIYDASEYDGNEYVDATSKLKTRTNSNGIVLYAIGIDDNVSTAETEGVELSRKIMTDETVSKLTITQFNKYNLVFNYRATTNEAYQNLKDNNYLIARETESVASDVDMLAWLNGHGYKIVVDNGNIETIYKIFNEEDMFAGITFEEKALKDLNLYTADDKDAEHVKERNANLALLKKWFASEKENEGFAKGFAYLNSDKTFGASTSENGMGAGQYYIHYVAKDAAGNEKDISRAMSIGSYIDDDLPEIKFSSALSDSYLPNAKITFNAPTATDNYDNNMNVKVLYRYKGAAADATQTYTNLNTLWKDIAGVKNADNETLTTKFAAYHEGENDNYIELEPASTYTIDLAKSPADANVLQILAYVYDDFGNANIYGETINITRSMDTKAPTLLNTASGEMYEANYAQGAEIEIPSLTVADDAVAYMDYEVKVYRVNGEEKVEVPAYDSTSKTEVLNPNGAGRFTVNPGKFKASRDGKYQVSIVIKDSKNNTIVNFLNYDVEKATIIQTPTINTSFANKTIELDGDENFDPEVGLEIPTPTVNHMIDGVTYDEFIASANPETDFASKEMVIMGVDKNGKATDWTTTQGRTAFKPKAKGSYDLTYSVNVTVYNHTMFKYVPFTYTDAGEDGGYFTYTRTTATGDIVAKVTTNGENGYIVRIPSAESATVDDVYTITKQENGEIIINSERNGLVEPSTEAPDTFFYNLDLNPWFNNLKAYTFNSEVYTITVKDTKGPSIRNYPYSKSIDTKEILNSADGKGYALKIYAIEGDNTIDMSKSSVELRWRLANGDSGSETYNALAEDKTYYIKPSNGKVLDGTYTITYKVNDVNNNQSEVSYDIVVGDAVKPTISYDSDLVNSSYEIGSKLTINMDKIHTWDNKSLEGVDAPVITLLRSNGDKVEGTKLVNSYTYDLEHADVYTLRIEFKDAAGNAAQTKEINFTVTAKAQDPEMTFRVIGTVLIVISVIVLAGVIVYFVVSKVKLDKELKK